ncbi:MAG: hypothetical protein CMF59_01705 [Leptospiraceae bacterium]|nr:hypothetical protein [Leptospiraceae bacterium]
MDAFTQSLAQAYADERFYFFAVLSVPFSWATWFFLSLPFGRPTVRLSLHRFQSTGTNRLKHKTGSLIVWNAGLQFILSLLFWPVLARFELTLTGQSGLLLTPILLAGYLIIDDFLFYFYHRILHLPFFFRRIHSAHHEFQSSNALAAVHFHPLEFLLISSGFLVGPILLGADVLTFYLWILLRQWIGVSGHCGYSLPGDPLRYLPNHPGSAYHFQHHATPNRNYGLFFAYLDQAFGTYARPGAPARPGKSSRKG